MHEGHRMEEAEVGDRFPWQVLSALGGETRLLIGHNLSALWDVLFLSVDCLPT